VLGSALLYPTYGVYDYSEIWVSFWGGGFGEGLFGGLGQIDDRG
jgi:hypothetical protein